MKTDFSVYASLLSTTPADAENIAAWLADREAARDAMKMNVDMTVQDAAKLAAESGEYDEKIAVAQIRILSKRYTTEPDVIPRVAVVDKWDDDMWLIVPFSPYKTPATPGEMKTGLDAYGLHVLQAWNGRTVQDQILKKSYLFGMLPEKVRADALSLFRHELGGIPLPENFAAERGSRIVEAADPRRAYLDECIERLTPLSKAVLTEEDASAEEPDSSKVIIWSTLSFGCWGIADEPDSSKGVFWIDFKLNKVGIAAADDSVNDSQDFQIEGFEGFVRLEYSHRERCVYVRVYDGHGELSGVLDGWEIVGIHKESIGKIGGCGARLTLGDEFGGRLAFQDTKGNLAQLRKAEKR